MPLREEWAAGFQNKTAFPRRKAVSFWRGSTDETLQAGKQPVPRAVLAITAAIAAEIDRALANLENVLDRLIVQFTAEPPAFAAAYTAARKIVNAGNTHATPAIIPPVA